jgi:uncharacterized protein (TIGR00297 family)
MGGAGAACLVGGTVLGFGGWAWAALLVFFFASSSALSFVKTSDPRKARAAETFEKGGRRDAAQVLANGGAAGMAALLAFFAEPQCLPLFVGAFTGALAAATADTWATEIGVLSSRQPRMVTTGKVVPAGTSGGVTLLGSAVGLAGAVLIGLAASLMQGWGGFTLLPVAVAGGLAGSLADSLLGAAVQASYICPRCEKVTESPVHRCGTRASLARGLPIINNDVVNLLATATGAVVGGSFLYALAITS